MHCPVFTLTVAVGFGDNTWDTYELKSMLPETTWRGDTPELRELFYTQNPDLKELAGIMSPDVPELIAFMVILSSREDEPNVEEEVAEEETPGGAENL